MSVFGTTMTAFALVGSTGKSFERGIGTYGLMASISGLVHAGIFFLMVGLGFGHLERSMATLLKFNFFDRDLNQIELVTCFFPILVLLVVPYLLIGIIGAGKTIEPVTAGAFTEIFTNPSAPQWLGGVPPWLTGLSCILRCFDLCIYGRLTGCGLREHLSNDCVYGHGVGRICIYYKWFGWA